jgi:hypothetical protein
MMVAGGACPDKWQSTTPSDDSPSNPPDDGTEPDWNFQYASTSAAYTFGLIELGATDTTPPVCSAGSPSGNLSSGTTNTTISLSTDETANCRYSLTAGTSYSSMTNTFSATDSTSNSTIVSGLTDGGSYNYYIRCNDTSGNVNTDDYVISFSVETSGSACASGADASGDGSVSITELVNYIADWKNGLATITDLISGISEWKNGC